MKNKVEIKSNYERVKKVIDDMQKQLNKSLFNCIFQLDPISGERHYISKRNKNEG